MLIHFFLLSHSTTLIDNIFTNNLEKYALILSDISDHLPIFVIAHNNELKTDEASYIVIRDKNTTNKTLFCNHLQSNRMFFCEQYCNIAMQCCNIDVQVARSKLQSL